MAALAPSLSSSGSGSRVSLKQRLEDLIPQVHFAMAQINEDLGYQQMDAGNTAVAFAEIEGDGSGQEYYSFSKNSAVPKKFKDFYGDLCGSVNKKRDGFEWLTGNPQSDNHTEPKILAAIQMAHNLKGPEKGLIVIVSSRDVCGGCQNIIANFVARFPNIKIHTLGLQQEQDIPAIARTQSILSDPNRQQFQFGKQ